MRRRGGPAAELPPTGNTEQTRPENRAFFPALDGLRGVAFLMVFGQHYISLAWGWTGVNIFFVLSGFLITGILFDSRDDPHRARNFYIRRTLRIFPLYYGIFAVLLVLAPFVHWRWSWYWLAWPLYLGNLLRFLSPVSMVYRSALELAADAHLSCRVFPLSDLYFGHLWSLCVEEQFYLFWPWVVFFVRSRRNLISLCALYVILCPALRFLLQNRAPGWMLDGELLYRFTPTQFDALLLGGLVALLWRGSARARLVRVAQAGAVVGTAVAAAYLILVVKTVRYTPVHYPGWRFTSGLLFVDLYAAAILVCALRPASWTFRVLHVRSLRWVGRLSYGAYVFHDILHNLYLHIVVHFGGARIAGNVPLRNLLAAALALPATLLLAWLSFRFFESPFLNLKERWTVRPG